jgi:uncharacterized protein (TIGR02147 family)
VAHFNLEQAMGINEFFSHTDEESHFFILLVQYERAGNDQLRSYFKEQIDSLIAQRLNLKKRVEATELSVENQQVYYSSWMYGAVYAAITISSLRDRDSIAAHLRIPTETVAKILIFLESAHLIKKSKGGYSLSSSDIHLGRDSKMINQHHLNWRIKAIDSLLVGQKPDDVHYSVLMSISEKDAVQIRLNLVEEIEKIHRKIKSSKEEKLVSLCLDFFLP